MFLETPHPPNHYWPELYHASLVPNASTLRSKRLQVLVRSASTPAGGESDRILPQEIQTAAGVSCRKCKGCRRSRYQSDS